MKKSKKLYVRFFSPGSFFAESWTKEVDALDPHSIEWPDNAYSFTLHERDDVVDGDTVYTGTARQVGPAYYHPDSKVETLDEVRCNPKASDILIRNMEINKWSAIVWSLWGSCPQPFERGKVKILEA